MDELMKGMESQKKTLREKMIEMDADFAKQEQSLKDLQLSIQKKIYGQKENPKDEPPYT